MQATRSLASKATRPLRVNADARTDYFMKHCNPSLVKTWKSYAYTRHQRVQQLSPFELDVISPLFRNVGEKIKHKVQDNIFDVAPAFIFFGVLIAAVKAKRKQILLEHRD